MLEDGLEDGVVRTQVTVVEVGLVSDAFHGGYADSQLLAFADEGGESE